LRNPFVWAFVIGVITLTLMRPLLRRVPEPPPVIGEVPQFTLVDSRGEPFGSDDLRDRVYVANFFFTSCRSICLPMMQAVARLDERYRANGVEGIQIVSISVDPDTDTPEVLREYGEKIGADPAHWTLLTGDLEKIETLVVEGFKTALGDKEETGGGFFDIAHSGKLVLVDGDGKIRGYYDHDETGRDEIFHRSRHVRDAEK
jgi:protein SCO1/2